jgi:hypothetical protein
MTEKNYNPNQKENKAMKKQPKAKIVDTASKIEDKVEEKIEETKENEDVAKE